MRSECVAVAHHHGHGLEIGKQVLLFELADGSKLEPQMLFYCGTPPLPKEVTENPLYDFQWVAGKQVRIAYEEIPDAASICMAGKIVKITCLEEVLTTTE